MWTKLKQILTLENSCLSCYCSSGGLHCMRMGDSCCRCCGAHLGRKTIYHIKSNFPYRICNLRWHCRNPSLRHIFFPTPTLLIDRHRSRHSCRDTKLFYPILWSPNISCNNDLHHRKTAEYSCCCCCCCLLCKSKEMCLKEENEFIHVITTQICSPVGPATFMSESYWAAITLHGSKGKRHQSHMSADTIWHQ